MNTFRMSDTRLWPSDSVCLLLILCLTSALGELYCPPAIRGKDYNVTAELSYESMEGCLPFNMTILNKVGKVVSCDLTTYTTDCSWEGNFSKLGRIVYIDAHVLGNSNGIQFKFTVQSADLSMFLGQDLYLEWGLCDHTTTNDYCQIAAGGPLDECEVYQPCEYQSKCTNYDVGYECECRSGYSGLNCSVGNDDLNCDVTSITIPAIIPKDICLEPTVIQCWLASQFSNTPLNLSVDADEQSIISYDIRTTVNNDNVTFHICLTDDSEPGNPILTFNITNADTGQKFPVTLAGEILPYDNKAPTFIGAVNGSYFKNVTESTPNATKVLCVNISETDSSSCYRDPSCVMVIDSDENKNFGIQSLRLSIIDKSKGADVLKFIHEHSRTTLGCFFVQNKLIPATTVWFDLIVEDGGNETVQSTITFHFVDVNDPPVCQTNTVDLGVLSVLVESQNLTTINCTDPDTEPEFKTITYTVSKYGEYFRILNTGVLQVYNSLKTLQAGNYSLNITATGFTYNLDPRFYSFITATFRITIPGPSCSLSQVNPWPVSWQPGFTELNLILSCDTRDVGQLQINSVNILRNNLTLETNLFRVEWQKENITKINVTLKLLNYASGLYNAVVNATLGDEWTTTSLWIPIYNPPNITTQVDLIRILSTSKIDSEILNIHATSDVNGSTLTYSIIGGDTDNVFTIQNTTGRVSLMKEISTVAKISYELTFQVKDSISNLTSEKVVDVEIIPALTSTGCIVVRSDVNVYRPDDVNIVGYVVCPAPDNDYSDYTYQASSSWGLNVSESGELYVRGTPPASDYAWDVQIIVSVFGNNPYILVVPYIDINFKYYINFNCSVGNGFCITLNAEYCTGNGCTNCSVGWSGDDCSNDVDECDELVSQACWSPPYDVCQNTNGSFKCLDSRSTSQTTGTASTSTSPMFTLTTSSLTTSLLTTSTSVTTTSPITTHETSTTSEVPKYTVPNCDPPNDENIHSDKKAGDVIATINCRDQVGYPSLKFSATTEPPSIQVNIYNNGTITLASAIPEISAFTVKVTVTNGTANLTLTFKCNILNFCPLETQQGFTFEATPVGQMTETFCPSNYDGNVTRTCNSKNKWGEIYLNNCVRKDLVEAITLVRQLENQSLSSEEITQLIGQTSISLNSSFQKNSQIYSGDIKKVVDLFSDMSEAINRKNAVVNTEVLRSFASVCDKLVSAEKGVWSQVDNVNPAAGILESMEIFTRASSTTWKNNEPIKTDNIIISCESSSGDIQFPKRDLNIDISNWAYSDQIYLEKDASQGPVNYSVLVYRNMAQFVNINASLQNLYNEDKTLLQKSMNSKIVSFSVENGALKKPVELTFKLATENFSNPSCGFLNTNVREDNLWSTKGCTLVNFNKTHVVCSCNHTTNFAVLMSAFASPDDSLALSIISAVGCAISLFCLVMTIIVYIVVWKYVKNDRSVLHVNLSVCLIIGYVVFLAGVNRTDSEIGCKVVAVLLHFFFLVVFFTMLAEGIEILKSVSFVFTSKSILRYLLLVAYGAPLIIVAVSLGAKQTEGYGTQDFCWLSVDDGLIWAFVGPVLFVFLVNLIILIIVLKTMQTSQIMRDKSAKDRIKSVVRSISILSPILGLAWIFGVLSVNEETVVFQYLFAIFNSLQGLFVFIFQCLLQHQVKDGFKAMRRKYNAKSMDSRAISGFNQSKGVSDSYSNSASQSNNVTHSTYAQTSPIKDQQFAFHQYNNPAFQDNNDGKKSVKSNKSYGDNISRSSYDEGYRIIPANHDREEAYFYMGRTLYRDPRKEVTSGESNMSFQDDSFSFPSSKFYDRGDSQEPIIYGGQGSHDKNDDEHFEHQGLSSNIIDKWRGLSRRRSSGRDENPEIEKERLKHVYGDVGAKQSLQYRPEGNTIQVRAREHWKKVQNFAKSPAQSYPSETSQSMNGSYPSSPYHGPVDGFRQTGNVKSRPNLTPLIIPRPSRINPPITQQHHSNI